MVRKSQNLVNVVFKQRLTIIISNILQEWVSCGTSGETGEPGQRKDKLIALLGTV